MSSVIIAGGGLAGCLCALALARKRPDVELLVIEEGAHFGGNHTWSFFDTDIADQDRWLVEGIEHCHWPRHEVRFPRRRRTIEIGYNSIRSVDLDSAMRRTLKPEQWRLGQSIAAVNPGSVTLSSGEIVEADAVIDARGPSPMPGLKLGWQKFVGRTYDFPAGHGVAAPIIMDATVEQLDGYRFVYQLPISERELLIEDTYYSASREIDLDALRNRVDAVARSIGEAQLITEEDGVLPVVMDGDIESFWKEADVANLGLRGGFFHPTTSYSLPDAVANAALLARQDDLSGAALRDLFHRRAATLWSQRGFYRLLNRMLFRAAKPDQSYRVLEHFYRLPPPVIARFYAAKTTMIDKLRILSGRPPVPLGRAVDVVMGKAA